VIDSYLTTRLKLRIAYEFIFQNKSASPIKCLNDLLRFINFLSWPKFSGII